MWQLVKEHPTAVLVALFAHLFLLAFFIVNVDWHRDEAGENAADPIHAEAVFDPAMIKAMQAQLPKKQPPPPPPEPEKKVEPEPPKPVEKPDPEVEKRAAALELKKQEEVKRKAEAERKKQEEVKRKAEAERKKQEEAKRKAEAERKKQEEAKRKAEAERKKQEEAKRKAEAERKKKEEARRRALAEKKRIEAERAAEAQRLADELAREEAAMAAAAEQRKLRGLRNSYILAIKQRVQSKWLRPPGSSPNFSCQVKVRQTPNGTVLKVDVASSSTCDEAMRESVKRAVIKADPLPRAKDRRVFDSNIVFTFEP